VHELVRLGLFEKERQAGDGSCVAHSASSSSFSVNNRAIAVLIAATELA
jgi:hypothetical protein